TRATHWMEILGKEPHHHGRRFLPDGEDLAQFGLGCFQLVLLLLLRFAILGERGLDLVVGRLGLDRLLQRIRFGAGFASEPSSAAIGVASVVISGGGVPAAAAPTAAAPKAAEAHAGPRVALGLGDLR